MAAGDTGFSAAAQRNLSAAAAHFAAGRHHEALALATPLCQQYPDEGVAHKLAGCALLALGRAEDAVRALREAAQRLPGDAQTMTNLGNALAAAGEGEAAIAAHEAALELQPGSPVTLHNLGCALLQAQRTAQALDCFERALHAAPQDRALAQLCRELAVELGDWAAAERLCRAMLEAMPDEAGAAALLGALLLQREQFDAAVHWLTRALEINADDAVAWSNLCVALRARNEFEAAMAAGEQALRLNPDWGQAWSNLAAAQRDAGQLEAARTALLRALECDPECADAYYNLGCTAQDLGEPGLAREALIEAVKRAERPAWVLQAAHACRQMMDWEGAELLEAAFASQWARGEVLAAPQVPSPFAWLATPGADAASQLQLAQRFAARFVQAARPAAAARRAGPLRVGLLSGDWRDHATAHLLVGVLEALDRARIECHIYDHGPLVDDSYSRRLHRAVSHWVRMDGLSDAAAARRMAADGLDIAIDLKGWTQGFRAGILAHRPAPVQMQWLGFPGTMGAAWIDYIIADAVTIPMGAEAGYSERVLRMPVCYQPNDPARAIEHRPSRAELGLPEAAFVLAAFHQPYKITRALFAQWMRLLAAIPDAVLWMLDGGDTVRAACVAAATAAGIDPARLIHAPRLPAAQHLGRLAAADLALDSFPVTAHTTASDALWAGVPQMARCGDSFVSRVSASVVSAAGLAELIAADDAAYEAKVLALAADRPRLSVLRARLQQSRAQCALFDCARFAEDLSRLLEASVVARY